MRGGLSAVKREETRGGAKISQARTVLCCKLYAVQHFCCAGRGIAMGQGKKACQLLLSCVGLIGCLSASTFAADLPIRRAAPAYVPFTWTGFYGGVNVGYGWGDPQISSILTAFVEPGPGSAASSTGGTSSSAHSALGGF